MKKTNFTNSKKRLKEWCCWLFLFPFLLLFLSPYGNAQSCTLACAHTNIAIDGNCGAALTLGMFLNGEETSCPGTDMFEIIVLDYHTNEILFEGFPMNASDAVYWMEAGEHIGKEVKVVVKEDTDMLPENSCWTHVLIEDKLPPTITCPPEITVDCCDAIEFEPAIADACSGVKEWVILDEFIDPNNCEDDPEDFIKIVNRVIRATDKAGNDSDPCTLSIEIRRLNRGPTDPDNGDFFGGFENPDLHPPCNYTVADSGGDYDKDPISCDHVGYKNYYYNHYGHDYYGDYNEHDHHYYFENGYFEDEDEDGVPDPTPYGGGLPWIEKDGIGDPMDGPTDGDLLLWPLNSGDPSVDQLFKYCGIGVFYEDIELGKPDCIRKVMRIWTIREWFCGEEFTWEWPQIFEIVDNEGPWVKAPNSHKETTSGYTCEAHVIIPEPEVWDNCNDIAKIELRIINHSDYEEDPTPVGYWEDGDWQGRYIYLPEGWNEIEYVAYDECHNITEESYFIHVEDRTPPVAVCEEHTVISLTYDGEAELPAQVLDDGSYDDCALKTYLVRRMDESCDCAEHYPKFNGMFFLGEYNGHYYYISHDSLPAYKAFAIAEAKGGYVAVMDDHDEDGWVSHAIAEHYKHKYGPDSYFPYWIGLTDRYHDGYYEWQNHSDAYYRNWCDGFPDENCQEALPGTAGLQLNYGEDCEYVAVDLSGLIAKTNSGGSNGNGGGSLYPLGCWFNDYGNELYRYVLEIEDPCGWSEYTRFCCEDLGDPHMVGFRVVDKWGNYNDCMVEVSVQDKYPPHIYCPPDLTVACEFDFADISIFGTVVPSEDERGEIHIPYEYLLGADTELYGHVGPNSDHWPPYLLDGYAHDNCEVAVAEDPYTDYRDQCGWGIIQRNFKAWTPGTTDTVRCWQFIKFEPTDHFTYDNIWWPPDATFDECMDPTNTKNSIPPEIYGSPYFYGEDECDLVGKTCEDEVFYFNNSTGDACFKVIRTWSVIDWCYINYNYGGVSGQFDEEVYIKEHKQIFKIHNLVAPDLEPCMDHEPICTYDPECKEGYIELKKTATDDCTDADALFWTIRIDLYYDGSFDYHYYNHYGEQVYLSHEEQQKGMMADASGHYPIGTHKILWTVEDLCGNKSSCEEFFTIENCKAPTPYCLDGLAVDLMPVDEDYDGEPEGGMIELWAKDFDVGSSHPCKDSVILSFSEDIDSLNRIFTCADALMDQPISIRIYATIITKKGDLIQSYCNTTLNVQDNMNVCTGSGTSTALISGYINTENEEMLSGVNVDLKGSELEPVMTTPEGSYAFPSMPIGGNYTIDPEKNNDVINGVSTLDLVLIQKHILGLTTLDSPYKVIAADINKDQVVSASDLVDLRKLILGVHEQFQNNESWRFIETEYAFLNAANPLIEVFPEQYDIDFLTQDMHINFTGVKVGDVNNSAEITGYARTEVRNTRDVLVFEIEDRVIGQGLIVEVPVTMGQSLQVSGFQLTMQIGQGELQLVDVQGGQMDLSNANLGTHRIDEGKLSMSWNAANALNIPEGTELFRMLFQVKEQVRLSDVLRINSEITQSEAYNDRNEVLNVAMEFTDSGILTQGTYELMQNNPNPFTEVTEIGFVLPAAMEATISIHNVTGQTIKQIKGDYVKGYNSVEVDRKELTTSGILYYTLETDSFKSTRRMVVID